MKTPILTQNNEVEAMLDSNRPSIQKGLEMVDMKKAYAALIEYDEEHDRVIVSFSEDQLVLLHGMTKHIIDLQTICGSQPVHEMLEMESTLAQGVDLFYEDEDEQ